MTVNKVVTDELEMTDQALPKTESRTQKHLQQQIPVQNFVSS